MSIFWHRTRQCQSPTTPELQQQIDATHAIDDCYVAVSCHSAYLDNSTGELTVAHVGYGFILVIHSRRKESRKIARTLLISCRNQVEKEASCVCCHRGFVVDCEMTFCFV